QGAFQETVLVLRDTESGIVNQQPFDFGAEIGVVSTGGVQIGAAFWRGQIGNLIEKSSRAQATVLWHRFAHVIALCRVTLPSRCAFDQAPRQPGTRVAPG